MRKDQVDLQNAVVWIPDSKTPNAIAEVPLTSLAIDAFKSQMAISGEGLTGDSAWVARFLKRFPTLRQGIDTKGKPFRQLAEESGNPEIMALFRNT